jgi:hypothetical protein
MRDAKPKQETTIELKAQTWPDKARALTICDHGSRDKASEALRAINALKAEVETVFGDLVRKANEAHKAAVAARKKVEEPLLEAERIIKRAALDFDSEQERLRLEEQRKLQAEEDRKAELQRQRDLKALERQGASKRELKTVAAQPIIAPTVYVPPKIAVDEGTRDNWNVEVVNLGLLIQFAAAHPEHTNLLVENATALRSMARAQKAMMKIPGVRVFNDKVLVRR